jgi:hypothetical protein
METFAPTNSQLLLMISAFILIMVILLWRRFAPSKLRSKFVFDSAVKKAWILLTSEDQRVAFTHLMLDAVKSDGKVTRDEAEALYDEMDMSYKKKAAEMSSEKMYEILGGCDSDQKANIHFALAELLFSDGDFDPKEKVWLDGVKKKLA